ncbi:MAG: DUF418 domain-containing protein [Gemmatimonadales bacterium]|nr:DUF418 domain-containing protein [Gemmatimonadales bacterium]
MERDPAPIDPAARVHLLDALRGFALFGVCLGNIATAFSFWGWQGTEGLFPKYELPTDATAMYLYHALVDGKFYSIFSLMFGLGFALQLGRRSDGVAAVSTYRRRLWILAAIGLAHMLLWFGDILLFYALMGMIMVRLRRLEERRALRWVVILLALPIVNYLPLLVHPGLSLGTPFFGIGYGVGVLLGLDLSSMSFILDSILHGGVDDLARFSLPGVCFRFGDLLYSGRPFKVLAMFLLGMVIGRRRMWEDIELHLPMLRRVLLWGVLIGLPANLLLASRSGQIGVVDTPGLAGLSNTVLYALGVAPLAMAYVAALVLLWRIPAWQRVLEWLVPTGRMALTNYLMQTVIAMLIFYGVGLGLGGRLGPTYFLPLVLVIFAAQTLFSHWWLARHRFGPMEGWWRRLTYR